MAILHILLDENDPALKIVDIPPKIRYACLPIADGLEGRDIYELARKLAELLLEQVARP
jgi:hypothetical protein